MRKLDIENLYLEVTRNCTLECEHCFRGDKEDKYIPLEIIDKIFKDVRHINFLLLSGGEPFLAVEQLERIVEVIKKYGIKVDQVNVVTNGTVLSPRILKVLEYFSENSVLGLAVSEDKFHLMELERKGLLDLRDRNVESLKSVFKVVEYIPTRRPHLIQKMGRAEDLTQEYLHQINIMGDVETKYILGDESDLEKARSEYHMPVVKGNRINNYLCIDVNGNIVPVYCSYKEEEENMYAPFNRFKSVPWMINSIEREKVLEKKN